ncbi:MAG: polyketide synthase dehydratase domain-containing protein, partial [Myxococcota bacterium]
EKIDELLDGYVEPKPVATAPEHGGFSFDYASLLACAWGKPSTAFGPVYERFDGANRVARLPNPPYHFISRVTEVSAPMNQMKPGVELTVEYDVPPDAWYFDANGARVMPYAVLMEAALQPCGWLASYVGCALSADGEMFFRNLDGTGTAHMDVTPETGVLRTDATIKTIARAGGTIIVAFDVEMTAPDHDGALVFTMDTVFGFFPEEALANQAGIETPDELRERTFAPGDQPVLDLSKPGGAHAHPTAKLAGEKLRMIDRITGYWPDDGEAGLGRSRAEQDVDPYAWYFKAHFFQDPVQPGSLGIEALTQLLQYTMLRKGMAQGMHAPRFEAVAIGHAMTWSYRGQVLTKNRVVTTDVELTRVGEDERGRYAVATASLWVDGMRIYKATNLAMRLVEGEASEDPSNPSEGTPEPSANAPAGDEGTRVLSLETQPWLADHCPTYTRPAVPMMSIVDMLADAALAERPGLVVTKIEDVELRRWLIIDGPTRVRTSVEDAGEGVLTVTLSVWWEAPNPKMSRFDEVARGRVWLGQGHDAHAEVWSPQADVSPIDDPYTSGELFHGPAFQVLKQVARGPTGASGVLDASKSQVPVGTLHPVVLDGALQIIPHDHLEAWWSEHPGQRIAYPYKIEHIHFYGPTPAQGTLISQAHFKGSPDGERLVAFDVQVIHDGLVWCQMRLVEILMPAGPLGALDGRTRRAFLRDLAFAEGAGLSEEHGDITILQVEDVVQSDWFRGTLDAVYGIDPQHVRDLEARARIIAIKEHVGRATGVHPSMVQIAGDGVAFSAALPLTRYPVHAESQGGLITVADGDTPRIDVSLLQAWWRQTLG